MQNITCDDEFLQKFQFFKFICFLFNPTSPVVERFVKLWETKLGQIIQEIDGMQIGGQLQNNEYESCRRRLEKLELETKRIKWVSFTAELKHLDKVAGQTSLCIRAKIKELYSQISRNIFDDLQKNSEISHGIVFLRLKFSKVGTVDILEEESSVKMRAKIYGVHKNLENQISLNFDGDEFVQKLVHLSHRCLQNQQIFNKIKLIFLGISSWKNRFDTDFNRSVEENPKFAKFTSYIQRTTNSEGVLLFKNDEALLTFAQQLETLANDIFELCQEFADIREKTSNLLKRLSQNNFVRHQTTWADGLRVLKSLPSDARFSHKNSILEIVGQQIDEALLKNEIDSPRESVEVVKELRGIGVMASVSRMYEKLIGSQVRSALMALEIGFLFETSERKMEWVEACFRTIDGFKGTWIQKVLQAWNGLCKQGPLNYVQRALVSIETSLSAYQANSTENSHSDYPFFQNTLQELDSLNEQIDLIPDTQSASGFSFDYSNFKREMKERCFQSKADLASISKVRIAQDWGKIIAFVRIKKPELLKEKMVEKTTAATDPELFEDFFNTEAAVVTNQSTIDSIESLMGYFCENLGEESDPTYDLNLKKWNDFLSVFEVKKRDMEVESGNIQKIVDEKYVEFSAEIEYIFEKVQNVSRTGKTNKKFGENPTSISDLNLKWTQLKSKMADLIKLMKQFSHLFDQKLAQISEIEVFFEEGVGEWKTLFSLMNYTKKFTNDPWMTARFELNNFENWLADFSKNTVTDPEVKVAVKSAVEQWGTNISSLQLLIGEEFTPKIWKKLLDMLQIHKEIDDLTANDLISSPLFLSSLHEFENLRQSGRGEKTVVKLIEETSYQLRVHELEFKQHNQKCGTEQTLCKFIVSNFEKNFDFSTEKIAILYGLQGNPFAADFADRIDFLKTKFLKLEEALTVLKTCQQRWTSLFPIMNSEFIKKGKKTEHLKFKASSDALLSILEKCSKSKLAAQLGDEPEYTTILSKCVNSFELLQKNLFEFLELKRIEFPRFYFLGDLDLIEFLGNCTSIPTINSVLSKFFPAAKKIATTPDSKEIVEILSSLSEPMSLNRKVKITGNAQEWLRELLKEIESTLCQNLNKNVGHSELLVSSLPINNEQIVLLIRWVHFCSILRDVKQLPLLRDLIQKNIKTLTKLKPELDFQKNLKKSMMLDSIYQLELVNKFENLVKDGRNPIDSLLYYSMTKYLYRKGENLEVEIGSYKTQYGFEYLGSSPKLIQTPLTDRCFLTMTTALMLGLGGNPCGPAGTGKTESIKALGCSLGRLVIVFNCDETMEFRNMSRLFIGIVGSGAWGCFDEFNRLAVRELSAISQVISQIQTRQKMGNKTSVEINDVQLQVPSTTGIFITLNPAGSGYKGRNKLPKNLQVLFRSFAMAQPNSQMIARISFLSLAFDMEFAEKSARFLTELFDSASKVLDLERCYDWGLRGLKTLICQVENYIEKYTKMSEISVEEKRQLEKECIKKAIETNIVAKLLKKDKPMFEALFSGNWKVFDQSELVASEKPAEIGNVVKKQNFDGELISKLRESAKELELLQIDDQIQACIQIDTILDQRIGFGLVGPSGSGKSTMLSMLKLAREKMGMKIKINRFYAKSMSKLDLFGCYNKDQTEFNEGLFVRQLRESLESINDGSCDSAWIVFEGTIDPTWAENLNSALDDNQLFTLPTGERFLLPGQLKLIFETNNLDQASMASISRLGLLVLDMDEVTSKGLLEFAQNEQIMPNMEEEQVSNSDMLEFFSAMNIPAFLGLKNSTNSRLQITLNSADMENERNRICVQKVQFYANRSSQISNLVKLLSNIETAGGPLNRKREIQKIEIQINDVDMVQVDQFGTRILEEFICQIIDHGWYQFDNRTFKAQHIDVVISLMSEAAIDKLSPRILNRASFSAAFVTRYLASKSGTNSNKTLLNDSFKSVFHIYCQNATRTNLSLADYDLFRKLCSKSFNGQKSLEESQISSNEMPETVLQRQRSNPEIRANSFKSKLNFWKNSDFFQNRLKKLAVALTSPKISHFVYAYENDSFAEDCLEYSCFKADFEFKRLANNVDLTRQVFEIMECLLAGRKIVWVVDELSCQTEGVSATIDLLANYDSFSFYWEDFRSFSGRSFDDDFPSVFCREKSAFKIVLLWSSAHENEFEELLSSYSCFVRKFVSVVDQPVTSQTLEQAIAYLTQDESAETVQGILKSVSTDATLQSIERNVVLFRKLRNQKIDDLQTKIEKFKNGAEKIKQVELEAKSLSLKIEEERCQMGAEQKELDKQIERISLASVEVDTQKLLAEKLGKNLAQERQVLHTKKESINAQLESVAPIVEEAKARIKSLSKSNIDELRNYHIPPDVVLDIFGVLLRLMNEPDVTWNNMKKILGRRTVIEQIVEIDPRKIDSGILKEVENILFKKPDSFNKDRVARISVAAAPIAEFVKAIIQFVRTVQNIKPLEEEFKTLDGDIRISEARMVEAQAKVDELLGRQKHLKKSLAAKSLEIEEFKLRISQKQNTLMRATKLCANLQSESQRWTKNLEQLLFRMQHVEQYCLAASYYLTYCTSLCPQKAMNKFSVFRNFLNLSPEFSLQRFLVSQDQLSEIIDLGHPNNEHAIGNTFVFREASWCSLVVDPEQKMGPFFTQAYAPVDTLTISDSKFSLKFELAVKLGKTVLMCCQSVPNDALVLAGLFRRTLTKSNRPYLAWGDKLIDWNPKFRLIMCVSELNHNYPFAQAPQVLNYSSSKVTIQESILSVIVNWQSPELEKNKILCLEQKQKCQHEMFILENDLLKIMSETGGDLLEDRKLFETLDNIKAKSDSQASAMEKLNLNLDNLEVKRSKFRQVSDVVANTLQLLTSAGELDSGAGISLEFLNNRLKVYISEYKFEFAEDKFLMDFLETFAWETGLSLPEDQKLVLFLALCHEVGLMGLEKVKHEIEIQAETKGRKTEGQNTAISILTKFDLGQSESLKRENLTQNIKKLQHLKKLFKNFANDSEVLSKCESVNDLRGKFEHLTPIVKLILARHFSPEIFEPIAIQLISQAISPKLFSTKIETDWLVNQNFSQKILILGSNISKVINSELVLEACKKCPTKLSFLNILIGTIPSSNLLSKLIDSHDKPVIVLLESIQAHYDSLVTVLQFLENYSQKFHHKFKIIITTENVDGLPTQLIQNSLKIRVSPNLNFQQNIENSLEIVKNSPQNLDFLKKLTLFHSVVLERSKYIPIGWSQDYEFSDFELKCAREMIEKVQNSSKDTFATQVLLEVLYLAKMDHSGDCAIMDKIFSKKMIKNERHQASVTEITDVSALEQTYLQFGAYIGTKTALVESICQKLDKFGSGLTLDKQSDFAHQLKHANIEKFNEFWCTHERSLTINIRNNHSDPVIVSFIDSELTVMARIIDILKKISQSVSKYLEGKIKMTDIYLGRDVAVEQVPAELTDIWADGTNLFGYLQGLVKMSQKLKKNCENLTSGQKRIDLRGIICYRKIFEVVQILSCENKPAFKSDFGIVCVPIEQADFIVEIESIEGAVLTPKGRLGKLSTNDLAAENLITFPVGLKFQLMTELVRNPELLSMPLFSDKRRLKHVCDLWVECDQGEHEFFQLSAAALMIHK